MNRLSKDVSSIDLEAAESTSSSFARLAVKNANSTVMLYFVQCITNVIAVLAVVVFSTPGQWFSPSRYFGANAQ